MPAWSPEIANDFIGMAKTVGRPLDQLQLQALVYIAHGWCLAFLDQPLTGDRPEAWEYGPVYRRLANALAGYGREAITRQILKAEAFPGTHASDGGTPARSELDEQSNALVKQVFQNYRALESWQLSALTRKGDTPWKQVFANGAGQWRDIPHNLARAQFVELFRQSEGWQPGPSGP
jgi:uncharacterized phage-associated protein